MASEGSRSERDRGCVSVAVRLAILGVSPWLAAPWPSARGATLPVPCAGAACGAGVSGFLTAGQASAALAGAKLTVTQTSNNATLNWQSFNISADGSVQFVQPSAGAVALNRIYDSNPSQIFGALSANGTIYLINQNGIVFGAGAQVNVGSLVASTLNINPSAVDNNSLLSPGQTSPQSQPAFQAFTDANGNVLSQPITIQPGATLQAADGGQILIFAPQVTNLGTIHTPDGQTMLAAGSAIYLASSGNPDMRGLLVEVKGNSSNSVTNGAGTNSASANGAVTSPAQLVGQIIAEHGNVTLAGLAVNQQGLVSANTSVNENGSIFLQARAGSFSYNNSGAIYTDNEGAGGTLTLGQNSDTEVTLDSSDPTVTVDSVPQPKSLIEMSGATVDMLQGSTARATSGQIQITTAQDLGAANAGHVSDGSRFYLAPGATLDVSGANITLPVSDNVIAVKLEATELADSPFQRDGILHGQTIYVDIRDHGTNADGSTWWGTPVADVSGEIEAISRNVEERNLTGGTISIQSQGDAILAPGSNVNVSGGRVQYTGGYIDTTNLLTSSGEVVPIGAASPDVTYTQVVNGTTVSDTKWGVSTSYTTTPGSYSPGYVQGEDGGTLAVSTPSFILDGSVDASTIVGPYQRQPTGSVANLPGSLYRPYDEVPEGSTLIIGTPNGVTANEFVTGNVAISAGEVLPTLTNADGGAFDPLVDPLPASFTTSSLSPGLFGGATGFANVAIYSDGTFTEPTGATLTLPSGGSLDVRAGAVDLEGSIDVPGGTITATAAPTIDDEATALILGPQASLTARGEWVNDSQVLYPQGNTVPLYINGGTVSLSAQSPQSGTGGLLELDPGSLIDVSGGAQLTSAHQLEAGQGGSIVIDAAPASDFNQLAAPPELQLDATLRGYGLYEGGSLSVSAASVCIAASDCSGGNPATLWLAPQFFESGGFASYGVTADQGALTVAPGTVLRLEQQNLQLPTDYGTLANAATLIGLATPVVLPLQTRRPVNLSLTLAYPTDTQDSNGNPALQTIGAPSLVIPEGVVIATDPLGTISLSSATRMFVDGTLQAPGGHIDLTLDTESLEETSYDPTQGIWLQGDAVLDTSGVAEVYTNTVGQRYGQILAGGTVSVDAQRGYLEMLPGSQIDANGTDGVLDVTPVGGGVGRAEQIGSAGGSLSLAAAQGMVLGGSLSAAAGTSADGAVQPPGGSLLVALDGSMGGETGSPTQIWQLVLSQSLTPTVVGAGSPVPPWLENTALVSADSLEQGGFDIIALRSAGQNALGSIVFDGNVNLTAAREISLDAGSYALSPGGVVQIAAPYVELGSSDTTDLAVPGATAGGGVLNVAADFLELYGTSSLLGVGTVDLGSNGNLLTTDLRLRGLQEGTATVNPTGVITGALYADGATINLTSQQVYPTTLSQFQIDDPGGTIDVYGSPGTQQDLLSAGGSILLSAMTVNQDGVLRAPFGSITIDADTISLGAGSITSTSAQGLTIPFGTTQATDWVYTLGNAIQTVYGTDGIAPPSQQVTLNGASVAVQGGAVIDISGGGDLQAYEWVPGPGGTQDVLASNSTSAYGTDQFAIVPSLQANVAPYDPTESANAPLTVGEAIYLSGGSGLPAGTYVLLPARYALLPGAYLVSEVPGYQDIAAGQVFKALNGGTIVSGYFTVSGLGTGDSRTDGFDVTPTAIVQQEAQYTLTSANSFFASQIAQAASSDAGGFAASMRLPEDAGLLVLDASDTLALDGSLKTLAPTGARGAEVDISSADIVVTGDGGGASAPAGALVLTASSLDQLGAQTLLLGGTDDAGTITTSAQSVDIQDGAALAVPQLLLSAVDQISVDNGAAISASGAPPSSAAYALTGDGAFLAVSAGPQVSVTRSGILGNTGAITLASGATLSAGQGSIYLDATSQILAQASLSLNGGNLAVQAPSLALGNAAGGPGTSVLGQNVLDAGSLGTLLLRSSSAIQLYDGTSVTAQNISIDAPGLDWAGPSGDAATFGAAQTITLTNSQAGQASAASGTGGSLTLSAANVDLGGTLAFNGFGSMEIQAQDSVTGTSSGVLSTAGTLTMSASSLTVDSGATLGLSAGGAVALLSPASPASVPASTTLGGSLEVSGTSIEIGTQLALPSGGVTLTASSQTGPGITLDPGAGIDVAGVVQQYAGQNVASPGGSVTLSSASSVALAQGSTIDVSAGTGGAGGTLSISAPNGAVTLAGTLLGTAGATPGATFSVDAQSFGDFETLNQALNTGGFSGGRDFRLRGPGDLLVGAGSADAVTATNVSLEADQGNIEVDGLIDAAGPSGGTVTLAASGDVRVNGTIDAYATAPGEAGGTVEFDTSGGQMLLGAGSTINVSGGGAGESGAGLGGTVLLRVPQQTVEQLASGGAGVTLAGTITGAASETLEAYQTYQRDTISSTDMSANAALNPIYADATTLIGDAPQILTALGQTGNGAFLLEPGVEIDTLVSGTNPTGTLTLDQAWDLSQWHFTYTDAGGTQYTVPGVLTLRAQGGITLDGSLSDGFTGTTGATAFQLHGTTPSWSYRLVAGADLSAANPLAVQNSLAAGASAPADVTIGPTCSGTCAPAMVRTGTGFIDVAASGSLVLGSASAVLYTAGVASSVQIAQPAGRVQSLFGLTYPVDGGNINVDVSGAIGYASGASEPTQFVNDWLWRQAGTGSTGLDTAWTVNFQDFQQGIGALGGGNVTVRAGGDISGLSASIPSIGVQLGGTTQATSNVQVEGGGNLTVSAGGSILGGSYYVGLGSATLSAGGSIGVDANSSLSPLIGLGDASLTATARGDAQLAGIITPSLLNGGAAQSAQSTYFSTYGNASSATLISIGGSVSLDDESTAIQAQYGSSFNSRAVLGNTDSFALDVLPPTLDVQALAGSIDIARRFVLYPAANGDLQLLADQNLTVEDASDDLVVADAGAASLPTIAAPQSRPDGIFGDLLEGVYRNNPDQHAAVPVYSAVAAFDENPVELVALNGNVTFPDSTTAGLWSAKPVIVSAGQDVVDLNLVAQNLSSSDVTSISAGRDVVYTETRNASGALNPNIIGIVVGGPGELQVTAGQNVDLGTSNGVVTNGNLDNSALPANGASISVQAGATATNTQYAAFISQYIDGSSMFDQELVSFVEDLTGQSGLTGEQAQQAFDAMNPLQQRVFVEQVFFGLLDKYGREAADNADNADYAGAYAAIQALFPGANPNLAAGQTNPYTGDIDLFFSQINAQASSSNISLLAPGGTIDVGLALSPQGYGLDKTASQLGVVVNRNGDVNSFSYSNFDVNQSRVFAADGGNILVWSTEGNIDAGRGSKSALLASAPSVSYDLNGRPIITYFPPTAGSGIQALADTAGVSAGNVDLFAPHGEVNANDAGIVAGNLTIGAVQVLGTNNITVTGTEVGVPVVVTGLGASFAGAASAAGATSNVAQNAASSQGNGSQSQTPATEAAISFLQVFVTGLGEANCAPDDMACLQRESQTPQTPQK